LKTMQCIPVPESILKSFNVPEDREFLCRLQTHTQSLEGKTYVVSRVRYDKLNEKGEVKSFGGLYFMSQFSADFELEKQFLLDGLYEDIHREFSNHDEMSLISFASGYLLLSASFNRAYVIDPLEGKTIHRYNAFYDSDPQHIFDTNLYVRGCLCPDTDRLLAVIDDHTSVYYNGNGMRGNLIAMSLQPFTNPLERPDMKLLFYLDRLQLKYGQHLPYVKTYDGQELASDNDFDDIEQHQLRAKKFEERYWLPQEKLKEMTGNLFYDAWPAFPVALGEQSFLLPVFQQKLRSGGKGRNFIFMLLNGEGEQVGMLKGLERLADTPFTDDHFKVAVMRQQKRIFYKNKAGAYLFDYEGNLLNKCYFTDAEIKGLAPFKIMGFQHDGRIVLKHPKINEILIVPPISDDSSLKQTLAESLVQYKSERNKRKKQFGQMGGLWIS